jgi:hypothetical protein
MKEILVILPILGFYVCFALAAGAIPNLFDKSKRQ